MRTLLVLAAAGAFAAAPSAFAQFDDDATALISECGHPDLPLDKIDSCLERTRAMEETDPSPDLLSLEAKLQDQATGSPSLQERPAPTDSVGDAPPPGSDLPTMQQAPADQQQQDDADQAAGAQTAPDQQSVQAGGQSAPDSADQSQNDDPPPPPDEQDRDDGSPPDLANMPDRGPEYVPPDDGAPDDVQPDDPQDQPDPPPQSDPDEAPQA